MRGLAALVLVLSACGPAAASNLCPTSYTGQRVTVTGTVEKVDAVLNVRLTTLRDGSGTPCIIASQAIIGRPGDKVTQELIASRDATPSFKGDYLFLQSETAAK